VVDSLWRRVGGTKLPLDVSEITSAATFEPADPALTAIAGLISAAIRGEFGTGTDSAWYAVTSSIPTGHRLHCSDDPIGRVWRGIEPSATALRELAVGEWPLLAVWREGPGEWEQVTFQRDGIRQRWGVMWALGEVETDLALKLAPALQMVGKIVGAVICEARHPGYDDGIQQFGAERGWLSNIRPVTFEAGAARFSDDEETRFWAASMTLESLEITRDLDEEILGPDGTSLGVTAAVGGQVELVPDLVIGDGDFPGT
jgi:hypothetical protein